MGRVFARLVCALMLVCVGAVLVGCGTEPPVPDAPPGKGSGRLPAKPGPDGQAK